MYHVRSASHQSTKTAGFHCEDEGSQSWGRGAAGGWELVFSAGVSVLESASFIKPSGCTGVSRSLQENGGCMWFHMDTPCHYFAR